MPNIVARPFLEVPSCMTSREIAELTEKAHNHVLRDIDSLLKNLSPEMAYGFKSDTYTSGDPPRSYRQYTLDRDATYCLVAGYDPNSRMRIIKRWQALEARQQPVLATPSPSQLAYIDLQSWLGAAELLGCPAHLGQQEAIKAVRDGTGVDFSTLLLASPAQNDIPDDEVYLEPTELSRRVGMSPRALNRALGTLGLQVKGPEGWQPTSLGKPISQRHAWYAGHKTGYNLKWRASAVAELLAA